MKILFLTDSLSLPRADASEKVAVEQTYFNKLKNKFPQHEFFLVGIGGATILDLYKQVHYYKVLESDLVFLHCGIVDCAPRAFTKNETKILTKTKLIKIFKPMTRFLRKFRAHKYTKPKKFDFYLKSLSKDMQESTVYSIGILPASDAYEKKLPGITASIKKYNDILAARTKYISNDDFKLEGIMSDHHHLNAVGHEILYTKIEAIITAKSTS